LANIIRTIGFWWSFVRNFFIADECGGQVPGTMLCTLPPHTDDEAVRVVQITDRRRINMADEVAPDQDGIDGGGHWDIVPLRTQDPLITD
jgi:hypothetical protein